MAGRSIPRALAERLGADGTEALAAVFESAQAEWSDAVLTLAAERFERTLSGEISNLREDMAGELSNLRVEMAGEISTLRVEITGEMSAFRAEVAAGMAVARTDLVREIAAVRQDVGTWRVELFKWSFLFWIGQVAVIAGLLALMPGSGR